MRGGRTTSKSGHAWTSQTKGGRRQEEVATAGFKVIDGAPMTLRVTGLMMMMMMMMMMIMPIKRIYNFSLIYANFKIAGNLYLRNPLN